MSESTALQPRSEKCATDEPVGVVVMILGALFLLTTLFITFVASYLLQPLRALLPPDSRQFSGTFDMKSGIVPPSSPEAYSQSTDPAWLFIYFLVFLAVSYCVLVFLTGVGIYNGKPKSLSIAIVLFGLLTLSGGGWSILCIGIVAYCILRKLGVIGPPA